MATPFRTANRSEPECAYSPTANAKMEPAKIMREGVHVLGFNAKWSASEASGTTKTRITPILMNELLGSSIRAF